MVAQYTSLIFTVTFHTTSAGSGPGGKSNRSKYEDVDACIACSVYDTKILRFQFLISKKVDRGTISHFEHLVGFEQVAKQT